MSHRRDNSIYLTYHEATLYCSDIEYFRAGAWLNDHIILFAYEYFHYSSKYKDIMETVCLCHPMNTMLLQYGDMEDLASIANSLEFCTKDYIFVPVNNASFGEFSQNGTHWALLVVDLKGMRFLMYDSMGNRSSATPNMLKTIQNLSKILDSNSVFETLRVNVPQQQNSFDCGMYCICFTEAILENLRCKAKGQGSCDLYKDKKYLEVCTPSHITSSRDRLREAVEDLKAQSK